MCDLKGETIVLKIVARYSYDRGVADVPAALLVWGSSWACSSSGSHWTFSFSSSEFLSPRHRGSSARRMAASSVGHPSDMMGDKTQVQSVLVGSGFSSILFHVWVFSSRPALLTYSNLMPATKQQRQVLSVAVFTSSQLKSQMPINSLNPHYSSWFCFQD